MTVSDLIEELKKHPLAADVYIVYDSGVCWTPVEKVFFFKDSDDQGRNGVGLLEESSVYARDNP